MNLFLFIIPGIAGSVLMIGFVYAQPNFKLDEKKLEQQLDDYFESAVSNVTNMPFDLQANYSKEYTDLITKKFIINYCENNPNFTGCDLVRDKIN